MSTEDQAASGLGLDAQRSAIAAAASRMKLELAGVHADEGVSGATKPSKRPALARVLEELRDGDVLLVAKRDRLGRNVVHVAVLELELSERGVRIVSAAGEGTEDDEPTSRLMRRIIDAFAEYERDVARDRTKKALRAAIARGQRAGTVPFGFRAGEDGKLVEDLEEQRALALMQRMRAESVSYASICARLEAEGIAPRAGKSWHSSSVRSILATASRRPS